jgi:hypothetical protein
MKSSRGWFWSWRRGVAVGVCDRIVGQSTHQRHVIDRSRFADVT